MTLFGDLAADYGTPLYVYQLGVMEAALHDLRRCLPEPSALYYSVKANPHPAIVSFLHRGGCRAEISSIGELNVAREAGLPPHQCLYTGPAKTTEEITAALSWGIRRFSVESRRDLERVTKAAHGSAAPVELLLRASTASSVKSSLRMSGMRTQFGFGPHESPTAVDRVDGLHFFPVSNARDEQSLITALLASIETASELKSDREFSIVDLGGGFAAPFAQAGTRHSYPRLRSSLEAALDESLDGWRQAAPEIAFESGRYLTAECGTLVSTVMDVKFSGGTRFVLLDAGINHLGGMAGLGRLARPAATPVPTADDAGNPAVLAGPLCTPADVIGLNVPVGDVVPGDVIAIPNVGAYGPTASLLGFLSRPAPVEVVIAPDGSVESVSRLEFGRRALS